MGVIDEIIGRQSSPGLPAPVARDLVPQRARSEYMRGGRGVAFASWRPALRDVNHDVAAALRDAAARATDMIQNSGWVAGLIDQATANTIGVGLRLRAMPENDLFGMDNKSAADWRKMVEAKFGLWANDPVQCDAEGRRTLGQIQDAAFRGWFATGELFGELVFRRRYGSPMGTKLRVIPSTRICNSSSNLERLVAGVRMDLDDMPIAYRCYRDDPVLGRVEFERPARSPIGRPLTIHAFVGLPGQVRGITPMAPALAVCRQFDQLADATLTSALIQTIFAASLTSDEPTAEVMQGLMGEAEYARAMGQGVSSFEAYTEAANGWYEGAAIDVGIKGRIAHLFPGQKLEFLSPAMPAVAYKDFSMHLLRELCRCAGLTFESGTGDYTGATYSSVRMATGEIFAITLARRLNVVAPFVQPVYEAWLEEAVATGVVEFPGGIQAFRANRAAACRAEWRGSPKPQADDLKLAKAHQVWREMGVVSDQDIADDLGKDIEDVYAQRAREAELREAYGLRMPESEVEPVDPADVAADDEKEPVDG
jgi:lambda family phage portal protein